MPPAAPASDLPPPARNGKHRGLPIFLIALFFGVVAHAAGLALVHVSFGPAQAMTPPPPYVHVVKYRDLATLDRRQRLVKLYDTESLYIPTQHDYGADSLKAPAAKQAAVFAPYEPEISPHAEEFQWNGQMPAKPSGPAEALASRQWDVLSALGQATPSVKPLAPRGAQLQITAVSSLAGKAGASTGAGVSTATWPKAKAPPDAKWNPATFLVVFDTTGMVGEPTIENSSGFNTSDAYLQSELKAWFARHPLRPGMYRVGIGP